MNKSTLGFTYQASKAGDQQFINIKNDIHFLRYCFKYSTLTLTERHQYTVELVKLIKLINDSKSKIITDRTGKQFEKLSVMLHKFYIDKCNFYDIEQYINDYPSGVVEIPFWAMCTIK